MPVTSLTLASSVRRRLLKASTASVPSLSHLRTFFEVLFYTSLKTEEGSYISCDVIWLDPANPDPSPPKNIRAHRWTYIPFGFPILFNVSSLTKVANGTDPRAASLVVYPDDDGSLKIWGLVDHALPHQKSLSHEEPGTFGRPGAFQARIKGIGNISVWRSLSFVAELRGESISLANKDFLGRGALGERIRSYCDEFEKFAFDHVVDRLSPKATIRPWIRTRFVETLQRMAIRIMGYGHGGAVILTRSEDLDHISVKYPIEYTGISRALAGATVHEVDEHEATGAIIQILEDDEDSIPVDLYLEEAVSGNEAEDNRKALDSALWLVSLFSRVDGAVICDGRLAVKGYGGEITVKEDPTALFVVTDLAGKKRTPISLDRFGTRHRSMIRYCWAEKDALGVVFSQDGDMRVFFAVDEGVLMFENPRIMGHSKF